MHMWSLLTVRRSALMSVLSLSAHALGTLGSCDQLRSVVVGCHGVHADGQSSNDFDGVPWKWLGHGHSRLFGAAVLQFALAGAMRVLSFCL